MYESSLDAEHCLLLLVEEGSYFFLRNPEDDQNPLILHVDNANVFFPVNGCPSRHHHQTLLDGEFVYSYVYNKSVFNVHDTICVNGRPTFELPLTKRMQTLRDEVLFPLRGRYPAHTEAELPFVIMGKEYFEFDRLTTSLLPHIAHHADPNGMRFIYKNGRRYNENKGLVLISEHAYDPTTRYEWLWPELFPVIFHVAVTDSSNFTLSLLVPGTEDLLAYKTDVFELDSSRLLKDLNGATEGNIACLHVEGQFRYSYLANNSVSTVLDVIKYMEEVTTTVSRIELEQTSRSKQNPSSPTLSRSPFVTASSPTQLSRSPFVTASSPEVELITESPIGRTDSASTLKRPYENQEEQHDPKRRRLAYLH